MTDHRHSPSSQGTEHAPARSTEALLPGGCSGTCLKTSSSAMQRALEPLMMPCEYCRPRRITAGWITVEGMLQGPGGGSCQHLCGPEHSTFMSSSPTTHGTAQEGGWQQPEGPGSPHSPLSCGPALSPQERYWAAPTATSQSEQNVPHHSIRCIPHAGL